MKRSTQFARVIFLAGLAQVSLAGEAWAENTPWEFKKSSSTRTDRSVGTVFSQQQYGGFMGFACAKDEPRSRFVASVSVVEDNTYPWGEYTVSWRVDTGSELKSVWLPNPTPLFEFHRGGDVPRPSRRTPGLRSDEVLSVLEAGERVQSRSQVANENRSANSSGGAPIIHVNFPNARNTDEAWQAGSEIAAKAAVAVQRGMARKGLG